MKRLVVICLVIWTLLVVLPAYGNETGSQFTSFAGYKLGTVTLAQVTNDLGKTPLAETGDAGEYEASVCYRTPAGLIYFLSGEMGGSEHDLLGFDLSRSDPAKPCTWWPQQRAIPSLTLGGLRLGMTGAEFSHVVAAKVRWNNGNAYAAFESKRMMTKDEINNLPAEVRQATLAGTQQNYFDVSVSVMGMFKNGKLSELRVWKIESL